MKTWLKRIAILIVVLLVAAQFYRPAKPIIAEDATSALAAATKVPAEVNAILERSCKDCHSNRTDWPWYSNVAPVSWMVIEDVKEARHHMNFSIWALEEPEDQRNMLGEICEEVTSGAMPLRSYTWTHSGAALSEEQKKTLCAWTESERKRIAAENPTTPGSPEKKPDDHSDHKH
jgi:hypothetical protein